MRRALRVAGIAFGSLFSIQTCVALVDWLARWDWLKSFMDAHAAMAEYIRSPISYIVIGVISFGSLWTERHLKQAHLLARWTNWWFCADLKTTTWGAATDEQRNVPGWDMRPLNWHLLIETQLANDSDVPATLDDAAAVLRVGRLGRKVEVEHRRDVEKCEIDRSRNSDGDYIADQFQKRAREGLRGLLTATKDKTLTKGVGYSGWLRFYVKNLSFREKGRLTYDIFLIDALQCRHRVTFKKGSDRDWDKNFYIFPDH